MATASAIIKNAAARAFLGATTGKACCLYVNAVDIVGMLPDVDRQGMASPRRLVLLATLQFRFYGANVFV